jgi:hypothetical protein
MKNKALSALRNDDWLSACVREGDDGLWHWAAYTGDVVTGSILYGAEKSKDDADREMSKVVNKDDPRAQILLSEWLAKQPEWLRRAFHEDREIHEIVKRCAIGSCPNNAILIIGQTLWQRVQSMSAKLLEDAARNPNQYRIVRGEKGILIQPI